VSKPKIAIIGAGTAGALSACRFVNDTEIDWYYDPNINPQPVGEGTTTDIPTLLKHTINFLWKDLKQIDGNYKSGIFKRGWGNQTEDFIHSFFPNVISMHFNAVKLQNLIRERLAKKENVNFIENAVCHDDIDADYIIDCSGTPKNSDELNLTKYIPVNSTHIVQCYWEYAKFDYTLTIARPYGWVWAVPLGNRCSVGYMYNNEINTLEEVKEDIKNIFKQFNLIPSDEEQSFSFMNYYRKKNFTDRVAYNGNASFFLEPLEATTLNTVNAINSVLAQAFRRKQSPTILNELYETELRKIENVINLHYLHNSKYDTAFWNQAKENSRELISSSIKIDSEFRNILKNVIKRKNQTETTQNKSYGTWHSYSFEQNIDGKGIRKEMEKLLWQ